MTSYDASYATAPESKLLYAAVEGSDDVLEDSLENTDDHNDYTNNRVHLQDALRAAFAGLAWAGSLVREIAKSHQVSNIDGDEETCLGALESMAAAGGAALILVNFFPILNIFSIFASPSVYVLQCYQTFFGCLILLLELPRAREFTKLRRLLTEWLRILTTPWGRGVFFVFVGSLGAVLYSQNFLGFLVGIYMSFIGILSIAVLIGRRWRLNGPANGAPRDFDVEDSEFGYDDSPNIQDGVEHLAPTDDSLEGSYMMRQVNPDTSTTSSLGEGPAYTLGATVETGLAESEMVSLGGQETAARQSQRAFNFSAGPSCLPLEVLEKASLELCSWNGSGMSVMEMSHRGPHFKKIYDATVANLRQLLAVSDEYDIFFMHGGATGQFAAVPFNVLGTGLENPKMDFVVTGSWSDKAAQESSKFGSVNIAATGKRTGSSHYTYVPGQESWKLSEGAKFLHYCANETVMGVEFPFWPTPPSKGLLVADMSSNFCSKPIPINQHDIIYAGVQKNLGPAASSVTIVRKALLTGENRHPLCPSIFDFELTSKNESMYNTPSCWTIYMVGLVTDWIKKRGGLSIMEEQATLKSSMLYDNIDASDGYYQNFVERPFRSRMNVPFTVRGNDESATKVFVEEAAKAGLLTLSGHRSVGGVRASIYNGMPQAGVEQLLDYMNNFRELHPL